MIYLILKIFVYLALALLAGGAAGWILRHLAAARQDEEMQRTLADARARVPQFESLIRSRDEQINRLKEELKDKDVRINGLADDVREAEGAFKDKERELKQLTSRNETLDDLPAATFEAADDAVLADKETIDHGAPDLGGEPSPDTDRLRSEITRLEQELTEARAQTADAIAEAASAEAEIITLKAELNRASVQSGDADNNGEVAELTARLQQKAQEYERLSREMEVEQRRVVELERERELQNKSLQVLHQQLELARERSQRVAAG